MDLVGDVSHATAALARFGERHYAAKSAHDVDAFLAFFSGTSLTYADATLGRIHHGLVSFQRTITEIMPRWGTGVSYSLRMLGTERSAVVLVRDTPELFGGEITALAAADLDDDGRITRWVDYWDSRPFGVARAAALQVPADAYPATFGEEREPDRASGRITGVVTRLAEHLAAGRADDAVALFAPDAAVEDLTLRTRVRGVAALRSYLGRSLHALPYGHGSSVRRVLGGDLGGGYEWTNDEHPARRGLTAVALDGEGRIADLTAVWDGGLVSPSELTQATWYALEL